MKKMFTVCLICFTVVFSCQLVFAQKIEEVDGVRTVHNEKTGKWGGNPPVELKFLKTIGQTDSDDDNVLFHLPADIAFDKDGNIYVLDAGNRRIQKFDAEGNYLQSLSREGQGPGELVMPNSLDIDSEGNLFIPDNANQRISILTPSGASLKDLKLQNETPGTIRLNSLGEMVKGGGGMVMMIRSGNSSGESEEPDKLIKVLDSEGEVLRELGEAREYKEMMLNRIGNSYHFTVGPDDSIYLAFDNQNRIEKYSSDGKLIWRADRPLNFQTDKPLEKGSMRRSGGNVTVQAPRMNRCSNGIAIDGEGRVWVVNLLRQIKEEEQVNMRVSIGSSGGTTSSQMSVSGNTDITKTDMYQLDVYDPEGVLLGSFPLDHFADDIRIKGDKIYILDKMRGAVFYEYRIAGK